MNAEYTHEEQNAINRIEQTRLYSPLQARYDLFQFNNRQVANGRPIAPDGFAYDYMNEEPLLTERAANLRGLTCLIAGFLGGIGVGVAGTLAFLRVGGWL